MLQHIKVLMYHRIVHNQDSGNCHWTCVTEGEFRTHLQLLDLLGFTTITFNDYRLAMTDALELPRKPIILTFDDGYLDMYETAFPLMQEFGMKGVAFVLGNRDESANTWDDHFRIPIAPLMRDEHIRILHAAGLEVGSHSMTHADLSVMNEDEAWFEVSRSKEGLETIIGSPVKTFAYPYGRVTTAIKRVVQEAGYSHACGVYSGPPICGTDPYDIRRITITGGTSGIGFVTRLITPFERYQWVQWKAGARWKTFHARQSGEKTAVNIHQKHPTITERTR